MCHFCFSAGRWRSPHCRTGIEFSSIHWKCRIAKIFSLAIDIEALSSSVVDLSRAFHEDFTFSSTLICREGLRQVDYRRLGGRWRNDSRGPGDCQQSATINSPPANSRSNPKKVHPKWPSFQIILSLLALMRRIICLCRFSPRTMRCKTMNV